MGAQLLTDPTTKEPTIVKTRPCNACGDKAMMPDSRTFTGMETTIIYKCPACEHTVEIKSLSQAGLMSALGAVILSVITFIMVEDPMAWDVSDTLWYLFFLALILLVPVSILLPHWAHPVTGEQETTLANVDFNDEGFIEDFKDPVQRSIIKLEKHGFWRGFLTPIIFIVLFLGAAAIIGYINFTYFGN